MNVRGATVFALAAVASIALTGSVGNVETPSEGEAAAKAAKGGTLTYYLPRPHDFFDPQRMYSGPDMSILGRTVYRSWLTFPVSANLGRSTTTVPDLATDLGTSERGARTWSFTLKDGVDWEDGQPITCADFKYGASRAFATDVITQGPQYLLSYLDIPVDRKTGQPVYEGPYTKVGQKYFDRAVTCDGPTITYRFKKPWLDFPLAVAALHMMDPYREDKDRGARSRYQIFSNGPYRLDGIWNNKTGGTLVRNEKWDASTDSPHVRKALPDRIIIDVTKTPKQINEALVASKGSNRSAVTDAQIPSPYLDRITGEVAERTVTHTSPYVSFLILNFRRLTDPKVRRALAASTDVTAWVAAGGGHGALTEAHDIVNPAVRGYQGKLFPGGSGDPGKARQLLERAGVAMPYPIRFTYPSPGAPTTGAQVAALKEGWKRAGFAVTLVPVKEKPYWYHLTTVGRHADLMFSAWGADWPSASAVTPPQFATRPNLGAFDDPDFEALVDLAQRAPDPDSQTVLLQQADRVLAHDVAYIPLDTAVYSFLRGSDVTGYLITAACNFFPDLGAIGVKE
jgi:peptide/nickel transport system substrate-binding protein